MNPFKTLGWSPFFENQLAHQNTTSLRIGRVAFVSRGIYKVYLEDGSLIHAELTGKAYSESPQATVGDWVIFEKDSFRIQSVLDRKSLLIRKAAGSETSRQQAIAANVDFVFVTSSLNADLNIRRLERYLTLVWNGGAIPVLVLNKADLIGEEEIAQIRLEMESRFLGVDVRIVSAIDKGDRKGSFEMLQDYFKEGSTIALLGSSGVGKSTLTNLLLGEPVLEVGEIREKDEKGKHTTTARHLIPIPGKGCLIDTPGMRELGLSEGGEGIETVFSEIERLSKECRFRDCQHQSEPGCAVREGVDPEQLKSFNKLQREIAFQERQTDKRKASDSKRQWKKLSKQMRKIQRFKQSI